MSKRNPALQLAATVAIATAVGYGAWRLAAPKDRAPAPAPSALAGAPAGAGRTGRFARDLVLAGAARVTAVAADARGQVIVAGTVSGPVDLGGGPVASADEDVFVLALDALGKQRWIKHFPAPGVQAPAAVAIDREGNVILAGTLDQEADFGGGPLRSAGMIDVFVLKLDAAGKHLWSKRFGDAAEQEANAIAVDREGNVIIAGSYEGTLDFGGGPLASAGADDVYVAKLDASGKHVWSKRFGDAAGQRGRAVAASADGSIAIAGRLAGTVDFGGGPITATDSEDLFLARFDGAGKHLSSRRFAGHRGAIADPRALAIQADGAIAITGVARGTVDLGTGPRAGDEGAFVMIVDPAGETRLARRFEGAIEPRALADLGDGALAIAGSFEDTVSFGTKTLASAGRDDAFAITIDASGEVSDARRIGDADRQGATAAAAAPGLLVIGGNFQGVVDFGAGPRRGPGAFVITSSRAK